MTAGAVETGTTLVPVAYLIYFSLAYIVSRWSYAVASKLPNWLKLDWKHQAETFLEKDDASPAPGYSWWTPWGGHDKSEGSKNPVRWLPLIGPLLSREMPLFRNELWMFGLTWLLTVFCDPLDALTGIIFFGILRCGSMVDHKTQLLPDCLTLPLMWFGLFKSLIVGNSVPMLVGAIVAYMMLWFLQRIYLILRKIEGLGGGDLKVAAAVGAWVGVTLVPAVLFVGSIVGIVYAVGNSIYGQGFKKTLVAMVTFKGFGRFALGPSLAIAGYIMYYASHLMPVYIDALKAAHVLS